MQRAPLAVGLVFGVSLAIVVTLVGPLLLFNPWSTSALQARHDVPATLNATQAEVDRVTGEILFDLYTDGPFDAALTVQEPLLDEQERSHMHDVAVLVRVLAAVVLLAGILAAVVSPDSVLGLAVALAVLGIGWNFGLVAGTAILTAAVPLATRARTQGAVDLCIALAGAGGGLGSGLVVASSSYGTLALIGGLLALAIVPVIAMASGPPPSAEDEAHVTMAAGTPAPLG